MQGLCRKTFRSKDMIPKIQEVLDRVWRVASGESPLPSPEWADEEYILHCGELSDAEKKDSFLSDVAEEISRLVYYDEARGEKKK